MDFKEGEIVEICWNPDCNMLIKNLGYRSCEVLFLRIRIIQNDM